MNHKFLVDAMLGKLSRMLRIFGYDTIYADDLEDYFNLSPLPDSKLLEYALKHDRLIITRDLPFHQIAKENSIYVESTEVYENLLELKKRLHLEYNYDALNARCSVCNGELEMVKEKASIADLVKPQTLKYHDMFYQCSNCDKIYWKGSHIEKIMSKLRSLESK